MFTPSAFQVMGAGACRRTLVFDWLYQDLMIDFVFILYWVVLRTYFDFIIYLRRLGPVPEGPVSGRGRAVPPPARVCGVRVPGCSRTGAASGGAMDEGPCGRHSRSGPRWSGRS